MKHRNKVRKHRNRGKYIFDDCWGFKKNFARGYYDAKEFKKEVYKYYR